MAKIWDANKLSGNLDVIAGLYPSVTGQKLNINSNGDLSIYKPIKFAIQAYRRSDQASVTSVDDFQKPIKKLFSEAHKDHNISQTRINNALRGLKALRLSYSGSKLTALDKLIMDIRVEASQPPGLMLFHQQYAKYSRFVFAQAHFLSGENEGICMALTYYWIRKRTADSDWKFTMPEITKQAENLQSIQDKYAQVLNKSSIVKRIIELEEVLDISDTLDLTYPKSIGGSEKAVKEKDKGSVVFGNILKACRSLEGTKLFFLTYEGEKAHAVGLDLRKEKICLFDANMGEFRFPNTEEDKFLEFCDDMWTRVRPPGMLYWDLAQVNV